MKSSCIIPTSFNPALAVSALCDEHVRYLPRYVAEIAGTLAYTIDFMAWNADEACYPKHKFSEENLWVIWASANTQNLMWFNEYFKALQVEYFERFGKVGTYSAAAIAFNKWVDRGIYRVPTGLQRHGEWSASFPVPVGYEVTKDSIVSLVWRDWYNDYLKANMKPTWTHGRAPASWIFPELYLSGSKRKSKHPKQPKQQIKIDFEES